MKIIEKNKGFILIGFGLVLLAANGWVTVRLLTLVLSLILINYGLLKLGKPSLFNCVREALLMLKFW